jgi:hypothetical protein
MDKMPDNTLPPARRSNPVVFTLLVTAALAGAALAGASLNGVTGDSVQNVLRGAGFGWNAEIMAEQHRLALALQNVELTLQNVELAVSRARADVAQLNARVDEAENLYQEAVNAEPASPAADGPNSGHPASGASLGTGPDFDLGALRSSFDEQTEHNRNEFRAVNRRIDWIEKVIYGPEGAVQPAGTAPRRSRHQFAQGWRVVHVEKGGAVISGKSGAIDVTPGFSVPELGRIAAIRQERGRWVVVTENGMTIRER